MVVLKKYELGNATYKEGILLSLLYLNHELELANMLGTKERLDTALVTAVKETICNETTDQDAERISIFLKRAFLLNKTDISHLIEIITDFEKP